MAKDELLIIRLQELKHDVGLVAKMLMRATTRGDQLNSVSSLVKLGGPETIGESLADAETRVVRLESNLSDAGDHVTELVDALKDDLRELKTRLGKAAKAATVIVDRMREFDIIVEAESQQIEDSLYGCGDMIQKIDKVIGEFDSGTDREAAWNKFDELIDECEPLFADYVDFLSGVTLRDYQLDDGVANLADRVFKELGVGGIAMPARQGHLPTKLTSLAKFQFPEWTVWDVPLAGYHAGLLRSNMANSILAQFRADHPTTFRTDAFAQQLFAEVYATCVIGPAYGYAALLLHLHPRNTTRTAGSPSAADRAHAILATLDYYGSKDPAFGAQVKRLANWWKIGATGGTTVPAGDGALFDAFVSRVLSERLAKGTRPAPYSPERWRKATNNLRSADDCRSKHVLVLDQLNAAWHLRFTQPEIVANFTADDLGSGVRPGQSTTIPILQRQAERPETRSLGGDQQT